MDEYISRDEVLSRIYATHSTGGFANEEAYLWIHDEITNLSAADVQPVKYGRWLFNTYTEVFPWKCSECNYDTVARFNYCPNCGARMDGDSDDEP